MKPRFSDFGSQAVLLERELDAVTGVIVEHAGRLVLRPSQVAHEIRFGENPLSAGPLELLWIELHGDLRVLFEEALRRLRAHPQFAREQPANEVARRTPGVVAIATAERHDRGAAELLRHLDDEAISLEDACSAELELAQTIPCEDVVAGHVKDQTRVNGFERYGKRVPKLAQIRRVIHPGRQLILLVRGCLDMTPDRAVNRIREHGFVVLEGDDVSVALMIVQIDDRDGSLEAIGAQCSDRNRDVVVNTESGSGFGFGVMKASADVERDATWFSNGPARRRDCAANLSALSDQDWVDVDIVRFQPENAA